MFSKFAPALLAASLLLGAASTPTSAAPSADKSVSSPAPSAQRRAAPARSTSRGLLPWLMTLFGRGSTAPKVTGVPSVDGDGGPVQLATSRVQDDGGS